MSDKVNVGSNMSFSYIDNSPVPAQNGIGLSNNMLPIHPVYKSDGTYFNVQRNPKAWLDFFENNQKTELSRQIGT